MKTEKKPSQKTYSEKLRDQRWQKKRLEILSRDEFKCRICFCESKPLHVHHSYYTKGANPWDYPSDSLLSLCEDCHAAVESNNDAIRKSTGGGSWRQLVTMNFLTACQNDRPFKGTSFSSAIEKFNHLVCNIGRARKSMDAKDSAAKDAHLQKARSSILEMIRLVTDTIEELQNEEIH